MENFDVLEYLYKLPKEILEALVVKFIIDEKVSYDAVSKGYIEYVKNLKEKQFEDYINLQVLVTKVYCDNKKNRDKNINACMRYLNDKKRVNLSKKDIEKIYKED